MHEADLATGFLEGAEKCCGGGGVLVREPPFFRQQNGIHKAMERCSGESGGSPAEWWGEISREAESRSIFPLAAIRSRCIFAERLPPQRHGTVPGWSAASAAAKPAPPPRAAVAFRGCPRPHRAGAQGGCPSRHGSVRLGLARQPPSWPGSAALPALFTAPREATTEYLALHLRMAFFFFSPVSQACLPQNTWPPFFLPACHIAIVLIAAEW